MKNRLPKYTLIALIGSPVMYIFASIIFFLIAIINFPDSWYLMSVSAMYGFESTRFWYVTLLSICIISSIVTFTILALNVSVKLTRIQKALLFPPVLFTILYSYFNLSEYSTLHYIFATLAVLSVFVMQYFFSLFPVIKEETFHRNVKFYIIIEILALVMSFVIFRELVLMFEIIFMITMSLWIVQLLLEDAKENSLTNNTKTGKMKA